MKMATRLQWAFAVVSVGVAGYTFAQHTDFEDTVEKEFANDKAIPAQFKKTEFVHVLAEVWAPGEMPDVLMQMLVTASGTQGSMNATQLCAVYKRLESIYNKKPATWGAAWKNQLTRFSQLYSYFLGNPPCSQPFTGNFDRIESKGGMVEVFYKPPTDDKGRIKNLRYDATSKAGGLRKYELESKLVQKDPPLVSIKKSVSRHNPKAAQEVAYELVNNKMKIKLPWGPEKRASNFDLMPPDVQGLIRLFSSDPDMKDASGKPVFEYVTLSPNGGHGQTHVEDMTEKAKSDPEVSVFLKFNPDAQISKSADPTGALAKLQASGKGLSLLQVKAGFFKGFRTE